MNKSEQIIWVEKYRPNTIDECILSEGVKSDLKALITKGEIPNLIFTGTGGVGKTTAAIALVEELDGEYYIINGSLNGNIDTLRTEIKAYASTISFSDKRKYVILDEADYLSALVQASLRNFMEEYSSNCGFILTCNYFNKIIKPLHSRCSVVEFKIPKAEKAKVAEQFYNAVKVILDKEEVDYDSKVVAQVVAKYFPDFRRTINELQRFSATGKINSVILTLQNDENFEELFKGLSTKNFNQMRKWVGENIGTETTGFIRRLYDYLLPKLNNNNLPQLVIILAEYDYKAAFVVDQEINMVAMLTQIMSECF